MRSARPLSDRFCLTTAPILTALILLLFYALAGCFPFGDSVISWCDMDQQVIPLLLNFKDILSGHGSALYSFQNAGGMNFWGVFFFFIASPFSFLTLFVPKAYMMSFMNILVLLKLSLCAWTSAFYFMRCRRRLRPELAALFGLFYSLSGYGLLFYQNVIWLDMMYLFPLLLLSFERLLYQNKMIPLILSLSGMMILNYYISYMVVIFTLLFFGIALFSLPGSRRKPVAIRFLTGSFIAAMLTAIIWLPCFLQYLTSGRNISILTSLAESDFLTSFETTVPMLFPSACVLVIVCYGLLHTPLQKNQLRSYVQLMLLLLIPVFLEPVNKMWHTGNYQGFPIRYGFMTTFMIMAVAAQLLSRPQKRRTRPTPLPLLQILLLIGLIALYGVFVYFFLDAHIDELSAYSHTLWGNMKSLQGLLVLFLLSSLLYLFSYRGFCKGVFRIRTFSVLCVCIFLIDSYASTRVYLFSSDYEGHNQHYQNAIALSQFQPEKEDSQEFYRVKLRQKYFDVNLVGGMGFPSLSHYTSLTSQDYMFAMKKLGYSSYWMEVGGYSGSILTDALLSVAYDIHWNQEEPAIFHTSKYSVSETPFYLPLGLATLESLTDTNSLDPLSRLEVQQLLFQKLFPGHPSPFTSYSFSSAISCQAYEDDWGQYQIELSDRNIDGHLLYQIQVADRQTLYFDCFDRLSNQLTEHINGSFTISVNGNVLESEYPSRLNNGLVCLGTFENETVILDIQVLQSVTCRSFGVFGIEHALLSKAITHSSAQGNILNLKADSRQIQGFSHSSNDQTVFLSVPYDPGWTLTIDGQKAELKQAFLGFTAFTLPSGEHTIELSYLPPGFSLGAAITIITAGLCAAFLILRARYRLNSLRILDLPKLQNIAYALTIFLFLLTVFLIYVFPMVISILGKISSRLG